MKRRFGNVLMIGVALTVGLAAAGMGYGLWFETLEIHGTVNTGEVNVIFDLGTVTFNASNTPIVASLTWTNDDNTVNNAAGPGPLQDPTDFGTCAISPESPDTSCDPLCNCSWVPVPTGPSAPGFWVVNSEPFGPDVGTTEVELGAMIPGFPFFGDPRILQINLNSPTVNFNGGYGPRVKTEVTNLGNIPIEIVSMELMGIQPGFFDVDGSSGIGDSPYVTDGTNGGVDGVCEPGLGEECAPTMLISFTDLTNDVILPGESRDFVVHICLTPASSPGDEYNPMITFYAVNWNEAGTFDPDDFN